MMIRSYRDLDVWKKGMGLAVECYQLAATFPRAERFELAAQIRRSAASVPANIAEGRGRRTTGDFLRFLDIAYGSLVELETHVMLAQRLGLCNESSVDEILRHSAEVGRMLNGLRASLKHKRAHELDPQTPAP